MIVKRLDDLLEIKYKDKMIMTVVKAQDKETLKAVLEAEKLGLIEPILIGDKTEIIDLLERLGKKGSDYTIVDEDNDEKAAEIGVSYVRDGKADFVMKGLIETSKILRAALDRETGIRGGALLSHIMAYDIDTYHKLIFLTDGGMNIAPTVGQKSYILENAIDTLRVLGEENIKVACLAARETVDEKMPATVDASNIKDMFKDNDYAIVDGPMALDLAISKESASIKGYKSEVAGDADILLVPNIEMGNGIGKSISYFAKGKSAGVVMGAKAPIILASRADTHLNKLYSIALGALLSSNLKKQNS